MSRTDIGTFSVAIVAAGRGERAGQSDEGPKQYRNISGIAVIARTIRAFARHERVGPIAVAIHPEDEEIFRESVAELAERVLIVQGGSSRQASVLCALRALANHDPEFVMIHDGVRPFIEEELIDRLMDAMDGEAGALPALPVADTLKRAGEDGIIIGTEPRSGLFAAQTPQSFPFNAIWQAHERAAQTDPHGFTDDAALAEWAGMHVRIVEGNASNIKLTWAKEIEMADRLLDATNQNCPDIRTGNGFDVHGFTEGDHVTLCGVRIPHDRRLSGHSDADVGLHALTDALLATCGAGDIGTHFPPTDPQWEGAASEIFLRHAVELIGKKDGRILNVDVTIIAEAPRIGPHRAEMIKAMQSTLDIEPDRISVKATTNERLGFVGRREGIAASATATVFYGIVL